MTEQKCKSSFILILMKNCDKLKIEKDKRRTCVSIFRSLVFTPFSSGVVTTITYLLHKNLVHLLVIKKIKHTAKSKLTHFTVGENDHRASEKWAAGTIHFPDHMSISHQNM